MSVDLSTLTEMELRAELERRKPPKPGVEPQIFYRVHNRGFMVPDFVIVEVTLQEEKRRWKVLDGAKYVDNRRFINKRENWKLYTSREKALIAVIDKYADAAKFKRYEVLWDEHCQCKLMNLCREAQAELQDQFGTVHNPLPEVMRKVEAEFAERVARDELVG